MFPCTLLSTVLTTVEAVSHKGMNNQDVPPECHHTSICDSKRVGQRGKSDFCPQATRADPSSSFP